MLGKISKYGTVFFLGMLYCWFTGCSSDSREMKPFINEFFFKLTDEQWLTSVLKRAKNFEFVWLKTLFPELHLFRKVDLPSLNTYPASDDEIACWMNAFGNMVEYIEQDRYEQIYPVNDRHQINFPGMERSKQIYSDIEKTSSDETTCTLSPPTDCKQFQADACSRSIKIAVLDAFFDTDHHNLQCNVMLELAYNIVDDNTNLKPAKGFLDDFDEDSYPAQYTAIYNHGTMCMGRIVSSGNQGCNKEGDTRALIVPLKFIDEAGIKRHEKEIEALKYRANEIDIYSCSYGLRDNIGFPTTQMEHIEDAFSKGVAMGRNCKGSIYLFPSGNGHGNRKLDNCNTDIYAKSINTITTASITMSYEISEETEVCPAAVVATFGSPDPFKDLYMNTTKPRDKCTFNFRGTSAATAYAAGMISHALRENGNFSKRDIEHMLIQTSDIDFDLKNIKWQTNGAGYKFNDRIGFGAINVTTLKTAAKNWIHVPEKRICRIERQSLFTNISNGNYGIKSNGCKNTTNYVRYLEHVELTLNISCSNISEVNINLISPMGTNIALLTTITLKENKQVKYKNFRWSFMTVHLWGENPEGDWMLQVFANGNRLANVEIRIQSLTLHGTGNHPSSGGSVLECAPELEANATATTQSISMQTVLIIVGTAIAVFILSMFAAVVFCRKRNIKCWPCNKNAQRNPSADVDPSTYGDCCIEKQLSNWCFSPNSQ